MRQIIKVALIILLLGWLVEGKNKNRKKKKKKKGGGVKASDDDLAAAVGALAHSEYDGLVEGFSSGFIPPGSRGVWYGGRIFAGHSIDYELGTENAFVSTDYYMAASGGTSDTDRWNVIYAPVTPVANVRKFPISKVGQMITDPDEIYQYLFYSSIDVAAGYCLILYSVGKHTTLCGDKKVDGDLGFHHYDGIITNKKKDHNGVMTSGRSFVMYKVWVDVSFVGVRYQGYPVISFEVVQGNLISPVLFEKKGFMGKRAKMEATCEDADKCGIGYMANSIMIPQNQDILIELYPQVGWKGQPMFVTHDRYMIEELVVMSWKFKRHPKDYFLKVPHGGVTATTLFTPMYPGDCRKLDKLCANFGHSVHQVSNDRLNFIHIPFGYEITVWDGVDFTGRSFTFIGGGTTVNMADYALENQVSSWKVKDSTAKSYVVHIELLDIIPTDDTEDNFFAKSVVINPTNVASSVVTTGDVTKTSERNWNMEEGVSMDHTVSTSVTSGAFGTEVSTGYEFSISSGYTKNEGGSETKEIHQGYQIECTAPPQSTRICYAIQQFFKADIHYRATIRTVYELDGREVMYMEKRDYVLQDAHSSDVIVQFEDYPCCDQPKFDKDGKVIQP